MSVIHWSRYFLPTLREDPRDAEVISHRLMLRAGLIRRLGSGAYSYLPFGLRALQKVIAIVREEMTRAGAQELLMPALQPMELWQKTGRDAALGEVLLRVKDRTGREFALGPTHEEVVTTLMSELRSHKHLPLTVYQIQAKFRDEPRPRFGVIRSKEFLMKDAYSFDVDEGGVQKSYQAMHEAYQRIFSRCGLTVLACEADTGVMGGTVSHEFMAPAESGEDRVMRCAGCGYAANREAAKCQPSAISRQPSAEPLKPVERVETPGVHTVEEVSRLLGVPPSRLIKTLLYDVDSATVAVLVRGDHEVNEAKLARLVGSARLKLSTAHTIERLSGAPVGFTGPVGLSGVRLLVDHAVMGLINAVTGANAPEAHLVHVNPGRDFTPSAVADLRVVTESDACPMCGRQGLACVSAIEVGHIFQLGTKYSQVLGAVVQDASLHVKPIVMGCYGIGVTRLLASVIEQRHDEHGIVWPASLAPFQALVSVMESDNAEALRAGEDAAGRLAGGGLEVLVDDRSMSPGSKLKDADLIGVPVRVVVGKVWAREGTLEVTSRATHAAQPVRPDALIEAVRNLLDREVGSP